MSKYVSIGEYTVTKSTSVSKDALVQLKAQLYPAAYYLGPLPSCGGPHMRSDYCNYIFISPEELDKALLNPT